MPPSSMPPTVISGPLARKEAALAVMPAPLTPIYLTALEESLPKERKQEVDDLSQVLGPLRNIRDLGVSFQDILLKRQG